MHEYDKTSMFRIPTSWITFLELRLQRSLLCEGVIPFIDIVDGLSD
jgi:hypothetical protein